MSSLPRDLIQRAETEVKIEKVLLDQFGIESVEDSGGWKTHCPLGAEHSDGGTSKSMRVYSDSNSAWCFSHSTRFTPVKLWQLRHPGNRVEAAVEMLEHYGFRTTPPTLDERWESLEHEEEEVIPEEVGELHDALITFARTTLPNYECHQYRSEVLDIMAKIYAISDHLDLSGPRGSMLEWLEKSKKILTEVWRKNDWY